MQEGTSSLMQMAKVSVAVEALRRERLPFVSVLSDPTYGGVSASYAMQADVRIASSSTTRIGFAGMCHLNISYISVSTLELKSFHFVNFVLGAYGSVTINSLFAVIRSPGHTEHNV